MKKFLEINKEEITKIELEFQLFEDVVEDIPWQQLKFQKRAITVIHYIGSSPIFL